MEATDVRTGKPSCIICAGLHPDSGVPEEVERPDEMGCAYRCGSTAVLNPESGNYTVTLSRRGGWAAVLPNECPKELPIRAIPFVDTRSKTFYCGCFGWD